MIKQSVTSSRPSQQCNSGLLPAKVSVVAVSPEDEVTFCLSGRGVCMCYVYMCISVARLCRTRGLFSYAIAL